MIRHLDPMTAILGGACAFALIGAPMAVMAQAPGPTGGAGPSSASSTALGATAGPSKGPVGSASGGSGGSAAAGGTSASTLGVGGSAAADQGGHVMSRSAVHGNNNLNGQAMAQAHEGGTFSKSHTHCKAGSSAGVACRTKSMAHVPGSKPTMSTTTSDTPPG